MRLCLVLTALLSAVPAAADTVPASPPLSDSFAEFALTYCSAVVSRTDESPAAIAREFAGTRVIDPPRPVSAVTKWGDSLAARFKISPDTPVLEVMPESSTVDALQIIFALTDGAKCIATAQGIGGAAQAVRERLRADRGYRLMVDGPSNQVYAHEATAQRASFVVVAPLAPAGVLEVRFERMDVRPNVSDANRRAWVDTIFRVCFDAARRRREPTLADFGEFMEMHTSTNGKSKTIGAPERYPPSVLFTQSGRQAGCKFMLLAGIQENGDVRRELQARLEEIGAVRVRAGTEEEQFTIAKADDGAGRAVRVTFRSAVAGMLLVDIATD